MKRLFLSLTTALLLVCALAGCHGIDTEPGYETVLVEKPWFFGHGGVVPETQKPGMKWVWMSTDAVQVPMTPIKYTEPLDHLPTADNNFINYQSFLLLEWTEPAEMVMKFGGPSDPKRAYVSADWYENSLKEQYRTIVRDVTKQFQMTPIMTDQKTLGEIERQVTERVNALIKESGLHAKLINVNMGKALPNPAVITEMDNTAAQQQRIKTEQQRKRAEDSRKEAENSRAEADNAYRRSMQLDPNQFVQLESIKRYSDACREAKGGCYVVQGSAPVMIGGK